MKNDEECGDRQLIQSKSSSVVNVMRTKDTKNAKQVLEEDDFVQKIDEIIENHFFPDLKKLKTQVEYQEALEKNDFAKVRSLEKKFGVSERSDATFAREPNSPSTFETPVRNEKQTETNEGIDKSDVNKDLDKNKKKKVDDRNENKNIDKKEIGLDQFLSKYTSEDNASFEQIQEEALAKHRAKYPWLYLDETKHNLMIKESLALPSIEMQAIDNKKTFGLLTWPYKNNNSVMYNPEGAPLTDQEKLANIKEQKVVHENTRFKVMPFNDKLNQMAIASAAQVQARQMEGKIGVDGKELIPKETPQVNGFKFVSMTPSPAPGVTESPFMTWGEIEGTPFRLDASNTPLRVNLTPGAAQFKIPDLPEREKIGLSLADKAAKQHRDKKKQAIQRVQSSLYTPSPSSFKSPKTPLERLNSMSPAAQKLATIKLGLHKNTDRTLLASYSPAHSTHVSTPKSGIRNVTDSPSTPIIFNKTDSNNNNNNNNSNKRHDLSSSLTDDLLKLPKRKKAAEFF